MDNYHTMLEAARRRCAGYSWAELSAKPGIESGEDSLRTTFFARKVRIARADCAVTVDGKPAGFGEALSVYDWLCDRRSDAAAAEEFCVVSSLPGVVVSGSGLSMAMPKLAARMDQAPEKFRKIMDCMQAQPMKMGDMGYKLLVFPDLPMCLKFYFGDEEFPPSLTLLWDRNSLSFVRYETLYYIAGCLQAYLQTQL